jgi:hypothetical protein
VPENKSSIDFLIEEAEIGVLLVGVSVFSFLGYFD